MSNFLSCSFSYTILGLLLLIWRRLYNNFNFMMSNTKTVKQTALLTMSYYTNRVPATLFPKRINSTVYNFGSYYVFFCLL